MIINEDNAGAFSKGLLKVLGKDIKTEADYSAFGGKWVKERVGKDNIFNYDDPEIFVRDVINVFTVSYPTVLRGYRTIIKDLARDYAKEKIKYSHKGEGYVQESVKYFNY
jgi:hypothetical protein